MLAIHHRSHIFFSLLFTLQKFIAKSDVNKSGDVSLKEFVNYLKEHDKKLRLQFSHLDKNKGESAADRSSLDFSSVLLLCMRRAKFTFYYFYFQCHLYEREHFTAAK